MSSVRRPTSFILSAPTLGVARQLKMALKNCLITLSKLFLEVLILSYVNDVMFVD